MKSAALSILIALLGLYVLDNYRHARHSPGVLVAGDPYQGPVSGGAEWEQGKNRFTGLAEFHLRARVLHTERYWLDYGASISPLDLAVGWGPMSDQAVLDEVVIHQGQRWYTWRPAHRRFPLPEDEIVSHSANIHTIPASAEIATQLRKLREGDIAELAGTLVAVQMPGGGKWTSSLSRTDSGAGACELMWIRSVKVD